MSAVAANKAPTASRRSRIRWKVRARGAGLVAGVIVLLLWTLLPLFYLVVLSVKPEDIMLGPPNLAFHPTLGDTGNCCNGTNWAGSCGTASRPPGWERSRL